MTHETSVDDIHRLDPGPRMSKAVFHSGVVYLCGQTSSGTALATIEDQTREVLARIDELLHRAGTHRGRLLSALVHLSDMADFASMNAIWEAWLPPGAAPARTTVQSSLAQPALRVEITVTAALVP